jgi:LPXTG-site transpeptidase (sortase) family protein
MLVISFVSFTALYLAGVVPNEFRVLDPNTPPQVVRATTTVVTVQNNPAKPVSQEVYIYPDQIIIDKIGVNTKVSNPSTARNDVLNNELLKGAVRYPGSGTVGKGNMFIFGHSTGIRVVNNQAYKAFNKLDQLITGDLITVKAGTKSYTYKVTSVKLVDSNDQRIEFNSSKNMLTLSTCNVLGAKEERFVVQADYVGAKSL